MKYCAIPILVLLLTGCSTSPDPNSAAATITAEGLMEHIEVLAGDEFEGRLPGTAGEDLTVDYLTKQFQDLGLEPGNPDGTYIQSVPLAGYKATPQASITVRGRRIAMKPLDDYVAISRRLAPKVEVDGSDMVFVGYGVVAPEYGWDDYKDADVTGKTIVMLINDPAVPDPSDPSKLDDNLFKGRAMTYYGRWTYKYEIATQKGVAAAIIVHETGPAGYPWEVVKAGWGGENFDIQAADNNMSLIPVESWITTGKARQLFKAAGKDFDELKKAATTKEFRPIGLSATASFTVENSIRQVESRNVIGKIPGAELPDEYVIFSAHWDHMGKDKNLVGDQIYNGALDNASGTSVLLDIARAFTELGAKPRRTILFAAVTAEEQGLLGAKHYGQNPLYPIEKTLANINIDGINQWGKTSDIVIIGLGNSTLDDIATEIAREQGRTVKPDAEPEKGFYYRADHFEFAKQGVPAFYTDSGTDYTDKPAGYAEQKRAEYTANDYHKVSDEIKPDWDLAGAVDDTRLLFHLGFRVAQGDAWPEWKPGAEFKARREVMLR
ncbi:MAG: M28 family peptidase [bacterium]|nr:M28 family peptidase [bacterium]